jgi:16S rRNA (cytosine967-C5)-methyltransferase
MADVRDGKLLEPALDRAAADLDSRDRRWLQEAVYGTLRHRGLIDTWLERRVTGGLDRLDPDVIDLLRLGVYQLLFMDSVPAYAAIGQTVELVKTRAGRGASGLVNAILRRIDRERPHLEGELDAVDDDAAGKLARRTSHPRWLVARWLARWGEPAVVRLLAANNEEAPLVLRPWGPPDASLPAAWREAGLAIESVPLLNDGWQSPAGAAVAQLEGFAEGRFFVQDPAATLVTRYAAIAAGSTVLDLCAAPGGKAFELARTASLVIAADRSASRLVRVVENVRRLRATNIVAVVADALAPPFRPVDAVLVDAPCTGTGTFRRHPDARWRLKPSDLAVTCDAQREILDAAAQCVRPGGLLIYSTCSLEFEENDARVADFLRDHPAFVGEPPPAGAVPEVVLDEGRLRVLPQDTGTDGAFAARLRRAR